MEKKKQAWIKFGLCFFTLVVLVCRNFDRLFGITWSSLACDLTRLTSVGALLVLWLLLRRSYAREEATQQAEKDNADS